MAIKHSKQFVHFWSSMKAMAYILNIHHITFEYRYSDCNCYCQLNGIKYVLYFWHNLRLKHRQTKLLKSVKNQLQCGSEYPTKSVFKWSKRGWMTNGPVFEYQTDQLINRQIDAILFSYELARYFNGWYIGHSTLN